MTSGNLLHWPGHGKGHTEICYDASGNTVFTSGCDGNVKIWAEFKDDMEPRSIKAGDTVYALATKGEVVYTASDNNSVDKYNISDGSPDGILLKFTSNVTHLTLSESQKTILAGSSDFTAKLVNLETNDQKIFTGHTAPILSIAADPLDEYLATVSCDGDFRIWSVTVMNVLEIIKITKPFDDIFNSESLCRMSWRPATGEDIAVPSENEIKVFSRDNWMVMHSFTTALTNEPFNCCSFSSCGRFLAAATVDGWFCIWNADNQDCLQTIQHALGTSICCLAWDPRETNILAFADVRGEVGLLDAVPSKIKTEQNSEPDDLDVLLEEEEALLNDILDDTATERDFGEDDVEIKKNGLFDDSDMGLDREKIPMQTSDFDIPSTSNLLATDDDLVPPPVIPVTANPMASDLLGDDEIEPRDDLSPPVIPATANPMEEDAASSASELLSEDEIEPRDDLSPPGLPANTKPMEEDAASSASELLSEDEIEPRDDLSPPVIPVNPVEEDVFSSSSDLLGNDEIEPRDDLSPPVIPANPVEEDVFSSLSDLLGDDEIEPRDDISPLVIPTTANPIEKGSASSVSELLGNDEIEPREPNHADDDLSPPVTPATANPIEEDAASSVSELLSEDEIEPIDDLSPLVIPTNTKPVEEDAASSVSEVLVDDEIEPRDDLSPPVTPATANPMEEDAASSMSELLSDAEIEPRESKLADDDLAPPVTPATANLMDDEVEPREPNHADDDLSHPANPMEEESVSVIPATANPMEEESVSVIPATASPMEEDAASSVSELIVDDEIEPIKPEHLYKGPVPTAMQPAFQSSATPMHLSHRFMVWNSVGMIRSSADDAECTIDVEFHDKQHHHALRFNNEAPEGGPYNTMADLSMNAVALAAESTEDIPSKLTCIYYASWEGSKEWSVGMPEEEEIRALSIGETWVAVCTDSRMVRMFSLAGMQRFIFSIPGPVVSMSAHSGQLFIVYHTTQGFNGNQCLGYMLLEVVVGVGTNRSKKIVGGDPLPISKKSSLQWMGFSAEGTPVTVDTAGVVRIMNRGFCNTWIPVSYLNKLTKSLHDHYWVIGLYENPQELRAILCKGSTYPSTLPRPLPTVLQYKLPLCEPDSEKSRFEEEYWRSRLFSLHTDYLESHGFEVDDKQKQATKVLLQQALMKTFALACDMGRESMAYEICNMLPSSSFVNLAIKYASQIKRMVLAQKLGKVVQEKRHEETQALMKMQRRQVYGEEEESADQKVLKQDRQAGYSHPNTEFAEHKNLSLNKTEKKEDSNINQDEDIQRSNKDVHLDDIPKLVQKSSSVQLTINLSVSSRDPFKKKVAPPEMPSSQVSTGGDAVFSDVSNVLDNITRKLSADKLRGVIAKSLKAVKKPAPQPPKKQQTLSGTSTTFQLTSIPKGMLPAQQKQEDDQSGFSNQILRDVGNKCTTGVQLYVSEMREKLSDQNPGLDSLEIREIAIQDFRNLTQEEIQSWNDRAENSGDELITVGIKRKFDDDEAAHNEEESENVPQGDDKTHQQPSSKLRKTDQSEREDDDTSSKAATFANESEV